MPHSKFTYDLPSDEPPSVLREDGIEYGFIGTEQKLTIMRPYEVDAVQHRVKGIDDNNGNGFVCHTTNSGKTLTSFNASILAALLRKLLKGELQAAI